MALVRRQEAAVSSRPRSRLSPPGPMATPGPRRPGRGPRSGRGDHAPSDGSNWRPGRSSECAKPLGASPTPTSPRASTSASSTPGEMIRLASPQRRDVPRRDRTPSSESPEGVAVIIPPWNFPLRHPLRNDCRRPRRRQRRDPQARPSRRPSSLRNLPPFLKRRGSRQACCPTCQDSAKRSGRRS